jgi:bile acid:Na+ symporter, BASS family
MSEAAGIDEALLNFTPASLMLLNGILAVIMFSIALDLKSGDFRIFLTEPRPVLAGLFSQFVVLPAATFLLVLATTPRPSIALGLMLVAACPGGNISNFITHRAGGNTALSVSLTAFSTVGAILLTPLTIAFWGSLYGPTAEILRATRIDPMQVVVTVGLMLILPLLLGMALNARRPAVAAQLRGPMQGLSMLIFVAFILIALAANWSFFLDLAGLVAGLVILHNAVAMGGGNLVARAARLTAGDRRALTIETGIQNSGLGLVLIFGFFEGLGGMAVVAAFWGIWHAISGIALASLWRRVPVRP